MAAGCSSASSRAQAESFARLFCSVLFCFSLEMPHRRQRGTLCVPRTWWGNPFLLPPAAPPSVLSCENPLPCCCTPFPILTPEPAAVAEAKGAALPYLTPPCSSPSKAPRWLVLDRRGNRFSLLPTPLVARARVRPGQAGWRFARLGMGWRGEERGGGKGREGKQPARLSRRLGTARERRRPVSARLPACKQVDGHCR